MAWEPKVPPVEIPAADLSRIKELYSQGCYRQALESSAAFGPPRGWAGPAARLIAGRLCIQLGAPRLGRQLHLLAFRESPAYQEAVYYHARYRMERFGPLSCWRFQEEHPDWSEASPELRADWLALKGLTAARFRDFDRAEAFFAQSEAIAPTRPWHYVERSSALELAESFEDALASARKSLEIQPWFRPGVQSVAHLLIRLGRESEALELLREAAGQLESALVVSQLAGLQLDLGHIADVQKSLDRFAELSPLIEPDLAKWLASRRADVAYLLGDKASAREQAKLANDDFYAEFSARLEITSDVPSRRVLDLRLPVRPASPPSAVELLCLYWSKPEPPDTDEEDAAASDGLPDHAERHRLESSGWVVREFTLQAATIQALIQRQLPFLLYLVETGYSQSRLVVGVDAVRNTLFFADAYERKPVEAPLKMLHERYASTGPRCLVAVPASEEARLDGIAFPDGEMLNCLHRLQQHGQQHRHSRAREELENLRRAAPDHRITRLAELAWARLTGHPNLTLEALDQLLAAFPHDSSFVMAKSAVLRELGRIHQREQFLYEEGTRKDADPLAMQSLAQLYLTDPRRHGEATRLLRLSLKLRPHAASGVFLLGAQKWEQQDFATAIELYRMAACLDEREEQFAEAYIRTAKAQGALSDCVKLYQRRVTRGERPTAAAVRSLVQALEERGEPEFARTALKRAIEKLTPLVASQPEARRTLGDLFLHRAEQCANAGHFEQAEKDLAEAQPHAEPKTWWKFAARIARTRPDFHLALQRLREFLQLDPLNLEGHRLALALIQDTQGKTAVRSHLNDLAARYPQHYPLMKLRCEYLTPDPDDAPIAATRTLLELCPRDAWAHRQMALVLGDRRRHEEALAAALKSGETESDHPSHFAVLGNVHRRADRPEEAMAAFRAGLARYVDHELVITELVRTARGLKEKKAALRYVAEQLHHQPHNGEGLLTYRDQALSLIDDPEEQLRFFAELESFLDERPDLWQCWSIAVQQLVMMHRAEEAVSLAREAVQKFPLQPRLWLDLAEACRVTNQAEDRVQALRKAVETAPGWTQAAKELSDALEESDESDEAVAVLEKNLARAPLDPLAYGFLAERLWEAGRAEEALAIAQRAVRHEPGYDWAWGAVANWGERLDKPEAVLELARDLARDRAGDPRVWMKLARSLHKFEQSEEALAALDRAILLDPKNPDPHDLKAERLAEIGRFDEALAATRPSELLDDLPLTLQGRAAWIEARRGNFAAAIPPMQALVAIDPDYYWGWQQLADWYNETGRPEAYLEAAGELCRLRPGHPTTLTMRGEAKIQIGDREGGKQDLRDALRLHNGYSPAAALLFDACLADDELKEARSALAVLMEHLDGPEGFLKQMAYAIKTDDEEAAVRAFRSLCDHAVEGSPSFMQMAIQEMRKAGWDARAFEQMAEAWRSGEPFHPWAGLLWLDTPPAEFADPSDRLAACQAVLREFPTFVPAYDRYAEQLARAGRYDEALAACAPSRLQPQPITLRGRAAWVIALRGDRAKAIELMRAAVHEDPDYTWGWRQISHWADDLGQHRDCLEAAEQLVRLAPDDPYSYGIRGEAKRLLGDPRGARDDYQRAFELDPTFEAAGQQLIQTQLATDDLAGAEKTLVLLRESQDSPLLKLRAVQIAIRQKDLTQALANFRALALDPAAARQHLRDAGKAFDEQNWSEEADKELGQLMLEPELNLAAAGTWVERMFNANQAWKVADRLKELVEKNPAVGREVILVYAWALAVFAGDEQNKAVATIQRFADLLRETLHGWARAGATLTEARCYSLAIAWLGDYTTRENLEAWMLQALADAYRAQGDDEACEAVLRYAEELDDKNLPPDVLAWLALYAALRGQTVEAEAYLADVDRVGLPDGLRLLLALSDGLLLVQGADPAEKALAFSEAREEWRSAAGACATDEQPLGLARIYKRCIRRIVADTGTLKARLWGWWQHLKPWVRGK